MKFGTSYILALFLLLFLACGNDDDMVTSPVDEDIDLSNIPYDPQPFDLVIPDSFPQMEIPADNPITVAGQDLGRHLFYDPVLSADSSMSCSSCHLQNSSFTDNRAVSIGIDGIGGTRSSMSLLNIGFNYNGLFWDGRSLTLEEQALLPVEDPIELHNLWPDVIDKLQASDLYREKFRKAFGIGLASEITKELAVKALAQFERSIVSSGNSWFDQVIYGNDPTKQFEDDELNGFLMFFDQSNGALPDAECGHCHPAPLFTTDEYINNGLDPASEPVDFLDPGYGTVTQFPSDFGRFRVPTLRNIALTAPYMHDGRFQTLEEVVEHYNSGGHHAPNIDPLITPLELTPEQQQDLIAFLKTLSDMDVVENPLYSNPF